eukprot:CAMPEP_0115716882 /NCGR_PEP_ID=MMETSP0272-20121206/76574_1 /TAXON_ID=71861 /ORGANISM="Scrippsiella trochoidea, Strain CCMP3099" /LENGTH=148 /DNA_ID=CAMNT_0003159253 /DNA_START=105 /DNA_END=549 /DNA_ORIENTATION=+
MAAHDGVSQAVSELWVDLEVKRTPFLLSARTALVQPANADHPRGGIGADDEAHPWLLKVANCGTASTSPCQRSGSCAAAAACAAGEPADGVDGEVARKGPTTEAPSSRLRWHTSSEGKKLKASGLQSCSSLAGTLTESASSCHRTSTK